MSDYTPITEFVTKDQLATNDPDKLVVGSELDAEFDAISTAIASKLNSSEVGAANGVAELNANGYVPSSQVWASYSAPAISASAVTYDCSVSSKFRTALTANITINAPTNPITGSVIWITLVQDATGSRTVTWDAIFEWPGGTAPTLTTTASRADAFMAVYDSVTAKWICTTLGLNYSV